MKFGFKKRRNPPTVIIVALIDVLMVVLIFLMVASTFKQHPALRLALPESSQARTTAEAGDTLIVIDGQAFHPLEDGEIVRIFDPLNHVEAPFAASGGILDQGMIDRRWVRIERPTIVVGGELTMSQLEVAQNDNTRICEAPLQMKSNCGCLLIDDFGRQRIAPEELLNRWIVPLENSCDYLTLPTGKKIQIPFEQLIIFSTNLDPDSLVDEAFLRRVPYKIFVGDPTRDEYRVLIRDVTRTLGFADTPEAAEHLLKFYDSSGRPLRRCHPRDLLTQVMNFCRYRKMPLAIRPEYLDQACRSYFSEL